MVYAVSWKKIPCCGLAPLPAVQQIGDHPSQNSQLAHPLSMIHAAIAPCLTYIPKATHFMCKILLFCITLLLKMMGT